jgi:hypothetical protein
MVNRFGNARSALVKMSAEDWAALRKDRPDIDEALRRACNIWGSQPIFDPAGKPTALLSVRLQNLGPRNMRIISAVLDRTIALTGGEPPDEADGVGEEDHIAVESGLQSGQSVHETLGDVDHAHYLIAELGTLQDALPGVLTRIRSQVEQGLLADCEDLADLIAWQDKLAEAASLVGIDGQDASLASLRGESARLLTDLKIASQDAALASMLVEIASVSVNGERMALASTVERTRTLVPSSMDEADKVLFRALYRVMKSDTSTSVDPGDADLVVTAFGMPAFLVTVGALASHESTATDAVAEPEDPPSGTSVLLVADELPVGAAPAETVSSEAFELEAAPTPEDVVAAEGKAVPGLVTDAEPVSVGHEDPAADQPVLVLPAIIDSPVVKVPIGEAPISKVQGRHDEAPPITADTPDASPDPRIDTAVRDGRTGLAYWYSVALGLPDSVQAAFEVLALSEAVAVDGDDASIRIRELLDGIDCAALAHSPDYLKVLAAGSARALLRMPFSPCANILYELLDEMAGDGDREFLGAVSRAGSFGFDLSRAGDLAAQNVDEFIDQRDAALDRLRAVQEATRGARTRYPRASDVVRRIMNDNEPIGGAVSASLADSEELTPAEALLAQLRDVKAVDRLIDDTDQRMNPASNRRGRIISGARDQIRSRIEDVLRELRAYVEAAHALASQRRTDLPDEQTRSSAVSELTRAAKEAQGGQGAFGVGVQAVAQVRAWTREALAPQSVMLNVRRSPIESDLSRAFEVARSEDGTTLPESVTLEALDAVAIRSVDEAYVGFAERHDFGGIDRLIDTLRADGQHDLGEQLAARQPDDQKNSRDRLRRLVERAEREIALARFAALLSESESADQDAILARYRNPEVEEFPAARQHLDGIIETVQAARARGIEEARSQLQALDCSDEARDRITRQLNEGDLVTAQEFLAQLKAGESELPTEATMDGTFTEFWPFIREATVLTSQGDSTDPGWLVDAANSHSAIAGRGLLPPDASPAVERGLQGWVLLASEKRTGPWERRLKDVLYLLGFEAKGPFPHSPSRSGQWHTRITAGLVGRALVPAYGSSADGKYQVLLCWGRQTPERILEMAEEMPRQAPILVLYFNTLSQRDRRTLAERSRNKDTSAVVIDNAVLAFLATRSVARLQTTMGLTLPFTAINPYTPFVLGDVPREVFYGRRRELHDVQDANGPLFVYGGRQLGKSTLLKTAMREFAETDAKWRSIYVDLKAEGIGELRVPDDLWSLLNPKLREAGIIDKKVSEKASPDVVVNAIRNWLNEDAERRILLLLDEADAFLDTDARARPGQASDSRFVNVYRLKNLMDGSGRRFKPVFAGLHQVQRFHSVSNGPMAHVGAEILIGLLPADEAYKLVVEPLAAIGYRFERKDIAWRLLAYTNYQASLIQAFCNALVRRLHGRVLSQEAPPTIIRDRDIEEVYNDREVRDWIASRFELTINLDNRYRVIAYTTAWLTSGTDTQVFAVSTLYDECKYFWPTGFASLNLDDFTAYLDEMVGLGVLVRTTKDEYGIRSPNVIRLLGSPAEIARRLEESEDVLQVSSLFDPAVFRRKLGDDPDRRSPLTEQQVQQVLEGRRRLHAIIGTAALGLDRVVEALTVAAPEDIVVHPVTCGSLSSRISSLARAKSGRQHVVLDLADSTQAEQAAALRQLYAFVTTNDRRTASCLASPTADWLRTDSLPDVQLEQVHLRPWTQDMLRAWAPECQYPLSTADQRQLLLEETGGWPYLVEEAAKAARSSGVSELRAREEAVGQLGSKESATAFLTSVAIPDDAAAASVLKALVEYSDDLTSDELVTLASSMTPGTVLSAIELLIDLGVLSNGSKEDSYRVNPLIARLLRER